MKKSSKCFIDNDGFLLKFSLYCIFFLILAQLFLFNDQTRSYLSKVDKLEGDKLVLEAPLYASNSSIIITAANQIVPVENRTIIVRMRDPYFSSNVLVAVNGKTVGSLELGEVQITVCDGDYIQIDARMFKEPAQYIIYVPDSNLLYPVNSSTFTSNGNIVPIGKAKF